MVRWWDICVYEVVGRWWDRGVDDVCLTTAPRDNLEDMVYIQGATEMRAEQQHAISSYTKEKNTHRVP